MKFPFSKRKKFLADSFTLKNEIFEGKLLRDAFSTFNTMSDIDGGAFIHLPVQS